MFLKAAYTLRDVLGLRSGVGDSRTHLNEAVQWLCRAQDVSPDRGVSHSYLVGKGWGKSYPETTGYIIPTLLSLSEATGERELQERAIQMADWELGLQLECGAIPSLSTGDPVVFDTGQVLFGWLAAYESTKKKLYLDAAFRAAEWLIEVMDNDGVWRKYGNPGSDSQHTYNVRVAWALAAFTGMSGERKYADAVSGFMDWVLQQEEHKNGWFYHNCLNDNDCPLLHTIAYTSQGLLETGILLNDDRYIDAAVRTSDALLPHVSENGRIPGRFDHNWQTAVKWSCLTGMAQSSIVWQKIDKITGGRRYTDAVERVHAFLKSTQMIDSANEAIRGGIKGSYPISGEYGKYRVLNWATKFFIDALMLQVFPDKNFSLY